MSDISLHPGCFMPWHELTPIPGLERIRLCHACQRTVHAVQSEDEAQSLGTQGLCVSVQPTPSQSIFIGYIRPEPDADDAEPIEWNARLQFLLSAEDQRRDAQIAVLSDYFGSELWFKAMISTPISKIRFGTTFRTRLPSQHYVALRDLLHEHGIALRINPPEA